MMPTTNCSMCAKPFPYRKNKQYCSDSCKQQAYNNRKAGPIAGMQDSDVMKGNKEFYLDEYQKFNRENEFWNVDLITYCFLSKNFDDSFPFANEAVESLLNDDLLSTLKKESHPVGRQFMQFQNEFFQGMYQVKKSRVTDLPPVVSQVKQIPVPDTVH